MPAPAHRVFRDPSTAYSTADSTAASPDDPLAIVWADDDGRPIRLVWHGVRWRVSDRPTVITEPVAWWSTLDPDGVAVAGAPRECTGWRFQATADDGRSCVLDVRDGGDAGRWFVVKVYD